MHAGADRLEFAPPPTPGLLRALGLAVLAHALLLVALTWSVAWKHDNQIISAEAELWSAVPAEAAPRLAEPPPAPEPPPPPPRPKAPPVVTPPAPPKVDIALQQEKLRKQKELARLEEIKQDKLKQQLEKERLEKDQRDKARLEKQKQDKLKQDKLKAEQDKLKAEKAQQAAQDKNQAALEAKQLEAQRQKNLQRMAGLAGATGGANATGNALKSSGPSASYGGRIRARIKPNIVFIEEIVGNPTTEVEVRTAPDGTIVGRKITKSSGNKGWDDAVLRAIDKTEVLPRDVDGSMPSALLLVFRPKD
ncbi:cell envelope integrity protein TolA [Rhodoferax sp. U2-2l]|uniref:cell envelope integrity protein TolA n=1 Tax=Rhodoferax sp. U2-2l TaxID=2884000 RepID=UPI001D0B6DAE|nr:cell envelope integrity protein TolA [Rhodoferax sp. U2-2l]MCB8748533.1 cell envelope integrity protein TolA [Rhodoferax sp. U2-2l]